MKTIYKPDFNPWEGILNVHEVRDVFTGNPINIKQCDVDHFIPSFGKNEITERIAVLVDLVKLVWNDDMFV